jgi:hypothetical protein
MVFFQRRIMRTIPGFFLVSCIVFIILIGSVMPAAADQNITRNGTVFVSTSGNDTNDGSSQLPVKTIGRAIEIASDGDMISIAPGIYNSEGDRGIVVKRGIRIAGAGPEKTIIDGMNRSRIVAIRESHPISFDNLTLTGGYGSSGGAVEIEHGTVRFSHIVIRNNSAESGGGVAIGEAGSAAFADSAITGNSASEDGGGVSLTGGSAEFVNTSITGNSAGRGGGGAGIQGGSVNFTDSELNGNDAGYGGGMYFLSGRVTLLRSKIINNQVSGSGGGMQIWYGNTRVSCSVLSGNTAGSQGGAIKQFYGKTQITSSRITNNTAPDGGSGIWIETSYADLVAVNNIFYNDQNVECDRFFFLEEIRAAVFSTNRTAVTGITGSRYAGGNAWGQPDGNGFSQTCRDADQDGICDSPYRVVASYPDEYPLVLSGPAPAVSLPCREDIITGEITPQYIPHPARMLLDSHALDLLTLSLPFLAVLFLFLYFWKLRYW